MILRQKRKPMADQRMLPTDTMFSHNTNNVRKRSTRKMVFSWGATNYPMWAIVLFVGCLGSLSVVSTLQQKGLFTNDYRKSDSQRKKATISTPIARTSSPSKVVMEAVSGRNRGGRLKRLRKRIFSKTRRGYRNDESPEATFDSGSLSETTPSLTPTEADGSMSDDDEIVSIIPKDQEGTPILGDSVETIQELPNSRKLSMSLLASALARNKKPQEILEIQSVDELRNAILDRRMSLSETTIVDRPSASRLEENAVLDHAVLDLIRERFVNGTTPGHRHGDDKATLALAIEGGGMRGCVSAGMVAAITALGLSDTIDSIYGSSAGSVVGAYMVSRQVCLDVYVDILPASKKLFVCKKRMVTNLASMSLGQMLPQTNEESTQPIQLSPTRRTLRKRLLETPPGMNISFVLDGIMGDDHGLRPLDLEAFRQNNEKQKLRVVASCVHPETGKLFSKCFGHEEFFCEESGFVRTDNVREGLFACLQASMTVPGATGPPVNLRRRNEAGESLPCFDAFCFEPIPYRSAVEEGATHVLALASRPEDYVPKTKQGIYETGVAPLYFNTHGQKGVSEYFEKGGQQYVYAEDLMLLEEAKFQKREGTLVPPPEILYGVPRTEQIDEIIRDRHSKWKKAHLLPLRVPRGYKELETLEQDKDAVLEAVRDGFMAAFDSLKNIVGLESLEGKEVAMLIFPSSKDGSDESIEDYGNSANHQATAVKSSSRLSLTEEEILRTKLKVPGSLIPVVRHAPPSAQASIDNRTKGKLKDQGNRFKRRFQKRRIFRRRGGLFGHGKHHDEDTIALEPDLQLRTTPPKVLDPENFSASTLLECLPGFQDGKYSHLAKGLIEQQQKLTRSVV